MGLEHLKLYITSLHELCKCNDHGAFKHLAESLAPSLADITLDRRQPTEVTLRVSSAQDGLHCILKGLL